MINVACFFWDTRHEVGACLSLHKSHHTIILENPEFSLKESVLAPPPFIHLREGSFGPQLVTFLLNEKSTWNHGTLQVWIMLVGIVRKCFGTASKGRHDGICHGLGGDNPLKTSLKKLHIMILFIFISNVTIGTIVEDCFLCK